jgi:hypothetical protein
VLVSARSLPGSSSAVCGRFREEYIKAKKEGEKEVDKKKS